uniref:Uncharacterized protein n=1 Tax=Romanomermis culicivorax TaxID=13658 RepID=A0A915HR76_ROMCU
MYLNIYKHKLYHLHKFYRVVAFNDISIKHSMRHFDHADGEFFLLLNQCVDCNSSYCHVPTNFAQPHMCGHMATALDVEKTLMWTSQSILPPAWHVTTGKL